MAKMEIEVCKQMKKTNLSRKRFRDGVICIQGDIPTPYGGVSVYAESNKGRKLRYCSLHWETDQHIFCSRFHGKDAPMSFPGIRRLAFQFVMNIHLESRR